MPAHFTAADAQQLASHGISVEEAERQLALLANPPAPVALERPCTIGDGLVRVSAEEGRELLQLHADVADRGRVGMFVPASGAASRMFRDLMACRAEPALMTPEGLDAAARAGRGEARALKEFLAGIDRFAFFAGLKSEAERNGARLGDLVRSGPFETILEALLDEETLDAARTPKGLLPFHSYPDGIRAAFEEHLLDATQVVADADAGCRLHFTVSPEHRPRFEARIADVGPIFESRLEVRLDVELSDQRPTTDTIAATLEGEAFRNPDGSLLLRPAGHGALIENLADMGADLLMVRNIDNVAHDRFKPPTFSWSRVVIGYAARLERRAVELSRRLERGADAATLDEAVRFLGDTFHRRPPVGGAGNGATSAALAAWASAQLARPIRVCGMVPNTGEPGGGPMWVRGSGGEVTPQIVELSQVDLSAPGQKAIVAATTHFNPVFMALAVRDAREHVYPLTQFVDPQAVMIARKSDGGRELKTLERPGLWNGAMAGWNSLFVEVPLTVFNPVKTVNDLLRKEHQPG
jgi:hypothetical protein